MTLVGLQRVASARLKQALKAGEDLSLSPVDVLGTSVCRTRSRSAADATLAKPDYKGRLATAEAHPIDAEASDHAD